MIRSILLICLLNLGSMIFVEKMQLEGDLLCKLQNLPHRGLGMLHWCAVLQPHRSDYVKTYLVQYFIYDGQEMLLEGQNRPVVPMYAVAMARQFPRNEELQVIRNITMANHFNKLRKENEITRGN
jgi:hypothetical protein